MIVARENLCDFCGTCVSVCPVDVIELFEASLIIDHKKCTKCMKCVKICPFEVLEDRS